MSANNKSEKLTYEGFKKEFETDKNKGIYSQQNIGEFADRYIRYINENEKIFSQKRMIDGLELDFYSTHIKNYLHNKLMESINENSNLKDELWTEFKKREFADSAIKNIAIERKYYHGDLRKLFRQLTYERLAKTNISLEQIATPILEKIDDSEKEYCKSELIPMLEKALFWVLKGGFAENLTDINSGIMKSNAGDGAELMFVGRAILAGYNCSQVDVRTSSYDAIIDVRGEIYRVQIKGFSAESVSFETQTRGGQGVDSKHVSNKSKRVTSSDCDLYVGVDKRMGICYIIPTHQIDQWGVGSKNTKELEAYRENWKVIEEMAIRKKHT